jgi:O-glycosyl hydrolase
MPILAADAGGYASISQQEEDVTPIDRNIVKQAEKSNRYKIAIVCLIVLAVIAVAFRREYQERPEVRLYESSISSPDMRQLLAADVGLAKINFGNIQCDPNNVAYACANAASPSASIEIQSSRKYQKILGFGGAFTEASAVNFYKLPAAAQEKVLQMYFGDDGIGYTLGRIHINSCDFSIESYDFDSVAGDYELKHFDMNVSHDEISTLPFLRAAMRTSKHPIKLVASPWSPPAWMKNPGQDGTQSMTSSATPDGLKDDPQTQLAWARYISKFITAYARKGVPIWSITPQNEPEFAAPWEACAYTAESENDFIQKYLGPVLREEHPEVLILGFDHNKDHLQAWTEVLMGNAEETYTNGMAFHC